MLCAHAALPLGTHVGTMHSPEGNATSPPLPGPAGPEAPFLQPAAIPVHPSSSLSPCHQPGRGWTQLLKQLHSWANKNHPTSSHTGTAFLEIFILGKGHAGVVCFHLSRMRGLSQGISEAGPEELSL